MVRSNRAVTQRTTTSEDVPEEQMTFLGHLDALRHALVRGSIPIILIIGLALIVRLQPVMIGEMGLILPVPIPLTCDLNDPAACGSQMGDNVANQLIAQAQQDLLPADVEMVTISPVDGVLAQVCVAGFVGLVLGMPFLVYQLGRFLSPALRPRERKVAYATIVPASSLFLGGALFAYRWLLPFTYAFLYGYVPTGTRSLITLPSFIEFTVLFIVAFGLSFELPVIMALLSYSGLVDPDLYRRGWRFAVIAIFIFAAVITPDASGVTMFIVAAPMVALYVVGWLVGRRVYPHGSSTSAERPRGVDAP